MALFAVITIILTIITSVTKWSDKVADKYVNKKDSARLGEDTNLNAGDKKEGST